MRDWSISAFFPEVKPAHQAQQSSIVKAETWAEAVVAGVKAVCGAEALKGKHISIVKLSVVAAGKEKTAK